MLAKYFLNEEAIEEVNKMGQELNRDLVIELKLIKARLEEVKTSPNFSLKELNQLTDTKKDLNKQRIKALGLVLIYGDKENE